MAAEFRYVDMRSTFFKAFEGNLKVKHNKSGKIYTPFIYCFNEVRLRSVKTGAVVWEMNGFGYNCTLVNKPVIMKELQWI